MCFSIAMEVGSSVILGAQQAGQGTMKGPQTSWWLRRKFANTLHPHTGHQRCACEILMHCPRVDIHMTGGRGVTLTFTLAQKDDVFVWLTDV